MPYFKNQGATLYYEESGEGKPFIFLHGASWDIRQWKRQVEHFSSKYRVITLDARGHGKSSLPLGEISPDVFWQDVLAMMDFLKISKAIICGLSMGGHVAIQVAINAKERVEALILIGAICTNKFNLYERLVVPINRLCLRLMPMSWIAWSISIGMGNFNLESRPYVREVVGSINHDVFNRVWKAVTDMESRDGLSQIICRTLLLIGDHDTLTHRQQIYMQKHIKGSRLVTIKNAHHGTNLDNPEQVEQEIQKFLQDGVAASF